MSRPVPAPDSATPNGTASGARPVPAARMAAAIRALSMDAVQQANSGHPGMPMGMADIAVALWDRHLKHDPAMPAWADRDRFVLSNGHGSMLLYSLLHLTGYDLPMQELRDFRQLHSRTPGHPEVGITPGVETTTGPLGQGIANAVGMALAEKLLAAEFNRPGHDVVDHYTWVFTGDGCLMEGVSHEACSLAGTLKLSKMVVLWDDNRISIDGDTRHWFAEDTMARFAAYGWHVIRDVDGHDADAVDRAIAQARAWAVDGNPANPAGRFAPTLIQCRTVIGKGSPARAGSAKAHGEPLGKDEIAATRAAIGWDAAPFEIPADVAESWDARGRGADAHFAWRQRFDAYRTEFPELAEAFERRMAGELPADWDATVEAMVASAAARTDAVATRKASQIALDAIGPKLPELVGGSADLTGSNLTDWKGVTALRAGTGEPSGEGAWAAGRHVNFGVREFGMACALNGLALHGGFLPYGGTFLTFSDYSRNALRMAALMKQRVIHVFTHDSIGLGEDGPTHQPIEHAATLRLIPNMAVWRPCDTTETAVAWASAVERGTEHASGRGSHGGPDAGAQASAPHAGDDGGPTCLLLSRQALPAIPRSAEQVAAIRRGGYVLRDAADARASIIATGSEIALALAARDLLAAEGIPVRVVSMPSTTVFDAQSPEYRAQVLPRALPAVAVEAGVTDGWWKYRVDAVVGVDRFGESAPAGKLFEFFGLTADRVAATVRATLAVAA